MLDDFNIGLTFNSQGQVDTVEYRDSDGCGHSALFSDPSTKLLDVVQYHLAHYKRGHRMEPARFCGFTLDHPGDDDIKFVCNLEPHIGDEHELVAKRIK